MTSRPPRQMKLFNFAYHTGSHGAGWRHPEASNEGLHKLSFYQELARLSEKGKFDAIFFADQLGYRQARGREAFSRVDGPALDPLIVLAALAGSTTHLGLVGTGSTLNIPFTLARQFASLDHLSNGRAGWNIVTSTADHEARNVGLDNIYGHDERYDRAAEYVEVVKALWDSLEDGGLVMDKASGTYIDPDKLHAVNHKGQYYQATGPLNVARPPQGYPVLMQAGSSDAGRSFSSRVAECLFSSRGAYDTASAFYASMKAQVAEVGRDPDSLKIMASVKTFVGETEAEAKQIQKDLDELTHIDTALAVLGTFIGGFDLSGYDLDGPVPPLPLTDRGQTAQAQLVEWAKRDNLTLRQLAMGYASRRTAGVCVGTPEQVADMLQHWFEGGAADGFVIGAAYLPGQFKAFVELVVPILQKRGLFRRDYEGETLRENLGLPRPPNIYAAGLHKGAEPDVW